MIMTFVSVASIHFKTMVPLYIEQPPMHQIQPLKNIKRVHLELIKYKNPKFNQSSLVRSANRSHGNKPFKV